MQMFLSLLGTIAANLVIIFVLVAFCVGVLTILGLEVRKKK
jgi:hypothetical protein